MLIDYYENEKELLKTFLRELLFNEDNTTNSIYHLNLADMDVEREKRECRNYNYLELIIRPECNLKCEYCYIAQYGKELYPIEQRVSNETILKNLNMLLNYIYNKNDLFIRRYSLFSGDLFYDNFIFDIFEVFYKYLYKQFIKYRQVQRPHSKFPIVLDIPTNPTFLHDDEKTARFEEWIDKFEDIGVRLYLSISTDGKYAIDTRERNGMTDEFWDKIFKFCLKHGYFFHPMIAAANIENWI